eukprot:6322533-Pyramimonas_sp.AAC.2
MLMYLEPSWRPSWAVLGPLGAIWDHLGRADGPAPPPLPGPGEGAGRGVNPSPEQRAGGIAGR